MCIYRERLIRPGIGSKTPIFPRPDRSHQLLPYLQTSGRSIPSRWSFLNSSFLCTGLYTMSGYMSCRRRFNFPGGNCRWRGRRPWTRRRAGWDGGVNRRRAAGAATAAPPPRTGRSPCGPTARRRPPRRRAAPSRCPSAAWYPACSGHGRRGTAGRRACCGRVRGHGRRGPCCAPCAGYSGRSPGDSSGSTYRTAGSCRRRRRGRRRR